MSARLALLASVAPGVTESEVFRLALHHAAAELGALGGTVHLRGPMSALRLVSSVGLPSALTRTWEIIDQEGPSAPARALRRGTGVWVPPEPAEPPPESAESPPESTEPAEATGCSGPAAARWPATGLAAMPFFSGERSIGVLSLVMAEPGPQQWDFLRSVIAWLEERMGQAPPPARPPQEEQGGDRLRQALKAVKVGSWEWHIQTGDLIYDEAAMELYGIRPEDFTGRIENWMGVVHPDDLPPTLGAAQRAIRDHGVYEAEYRVRKLDGTWGWTRARGRATYDDHGDPVRMVGMGWDSNESRSARDALSRALRHMSDGFLAVDEEWKIIFVNLEAERTLGFSEEELFGRVLWELPAVRQVPDLEQRFRQAAAADESMGFDVTMPDTGRCYHVRLVPGPDGRTLYLTDVTEQRRHQEDRRAAERAAAQRAARIAELTAGLSKAMTSGDVVDAVATRVLPPFGAGGLLVQVIEENRLHAVGSVGYSDDFLATVDGRPRTSRDPAWESVLSGAPIFLSSVEEYVTRYPGLADLPGRGGKRAWAFVPLIASGHTFGVCVVAFDEPRRLTDEERTLLTAICALVAQALERARLFDAEHTRSRELQRSLLPHALPQLSVCSSAARYLPAGQGTDVGGDWYDVIPLSGGQVALVVGDVMGHGLSEATTMGRLRTALHTLADLELPPDEIMGNLNDIVGDMPEESYVTCLYALYDATAKTCCIACAGHPPPAVVRPDGQVYFPDLDINPPLGAAEPPFETSEVAVPEGTLIVLYTDGLVESDNRDIDTGMADLARLLRAAHQDGIVHGGDLERLCDVLTAELLPAVTPMTDDAALLVTRPHALPDDKVVSWPLPETPQAAGQARRCVREQLSLWGLDELTPTTELLASELVGNVVRHAKGPVRLRLLHTAGLVCEVFDGSLTMPRIRRATETDEGGRGLQLVTALSQHWGTRYTPMGKCIWTEQAPLGPDKRPDRRVDPLEFMFPTVEDFGL
ncbi:SpoIIE family protein phosphatase [Streptomyces luomodiensis]|uniref:SpoIIE family protein phosphatase n=1 Tax=Streptomyces luomodiensis TaxID=3026192 RepID=A0ABY9V9Z4_9ACTN|nr:SpoIIE family protein phosphatase [Streptomyces sp. SCA4-21]WNF00710.1 SpoIIE family protein phosphatase [Streptomyces sp. SCA4-21]